MKSVADGINEFVDVIKDNGVDPKNGLGNELFLFASTLTPIVNVDLFVFNENGQILLKRRNDPYCGMGWHTPGSCIRFGETIQERIHRTALGEIGIDVYAENIPFGVYEFIRPYEIEGIGNQNERAHFISLPFKCKLIDEQGGLLGDLKWFDELPDDFVRPQKNVYGKDIKKLMEGNRQNESR